MFGDYTCVARNQLGSLRKVVTLAEGAKPGVPHVTVENIDQVRSYEAEFLSIMIGTRF